ncbi:MAG TPA: hypothetical protein PLD02_14415, partial [Saprospiraceae bacterium]|nr:hypothetical protein [Saprospiraceae bacterium]
LKFIVDQFKSGVCEVEGWKVGYRIVANDATPEVIEAVKMCGIPYSIFTNPDPKEYYLNRVYRAYNFCITSSKYDNICPVNSDQVYSKDWLANLLKYHDGINIPCSRLVESGKMPSGLHGINLGSEHFGRHPNNFNWQGWFDYAERIKENRIETCGLYMPCILNKERAIESGLYPNGNLYNTGFGNYGDIFLRSGDDYYFHEILEERYRMRHITVFDSVVYHIIEGEKDE